MDLSELKELLRSVVEHDISEFEYEEAGVRIRIKRKRLIEGSGADSIAIEAPHAQRHALPAEEAAATAPDPAPIKQNTEGLHAVTSPIVGTFYSAPTPGTDPFVRVGDIVQEGTVLCIVEAMKLMNEIKSDVAGKIVDILVENGQPVEYGQKLFMIQLRNR